MSARTISACRASIILSLLVVVAGCATTVKVGSDYDRTASFAGYHSYTLMKRDHHSSRDASNPLVTQRTEDAIKEEFARKGYVLASDPSSADFTVDFTIGSKERTDIDSYPAPYGGWGWGWGRRGWWGDPYWGPDLNVRQYRQGTLSIDIFDAHSHRPVWHGWANKELSRSDIEHSEEPIRRAVAAVLAKFPPSGGATG